MRKLSDSDEFFEINEITEQEDAFPPYDSGRGFRSGFLWGCLCMLPAAFLFFTAFLYMLRGTVPWEKKEGALRLTDADAYTKLCTVSRLISEYGLGEPDGDLLTEYMFKGIAAGMEDRYAAYYTKEEMTSVTASNKGVYFGIGIQLYRDSEDGSFYIINVYEDSPAMEAGIKPDDRLLSVNGVCLEGRSLDDVVSMIREEKEEVVAVVWREETEEELTFHMTCHEVEMEYVRYEMLEDHIGYLSLAEFTESAVPRFREAVEDLKAQGMEDLIIDLRGNPGGLLTSVCDIADEFLTGELIAYTENKKGDRKEFYSNEGCLVTCPVAVLVNGKSASASELFTGMIQDRKLGPIVGEQTYGKGIVQKTFTLRDGSAFKLTTEKYYTSGGQDISGNGITPDYVVADEVTEERDPVLEKAINVLISDRAS